MEYLRNQLTEVIIADQRSSLGAHPNELTQACLGAKVAGVRVPQRGIIRRRNPSATAASKQGQAQGQGQGQGGDA